MEQSKFLCAYDVDLYVCWLKVKVNEGWHCVYLTFYMNDVHDCIFGFVWLEISHHIHFISQLTGQIPSIVCDFIYKVLFNPVIFYFALKTGTYSCVVGVMVFCSRILTLKDKINMEKYQFHFELFFFVVLFLFLICWVWNGKVDLKYFNLII